MEHATELIRQIIRKQGLYSIYPGQDDSSFGDLLQTGWCQVERTLYKYRAKPHCRSCYNQARPEDSALYCPGEHEYGIKTIEDLANMGIDACSKCGTVLSSDGPVTPCQDTYGGTETVLYRGMSKVFNMWSQVARTVILAHIKKEGRDRKNSNSYTAHIDNKTRVNADRTGRFLSEARELFKYNQEYLTIIDALETMVQHDDKPHDALISKLVDVSGQSRATVSSMIKLIRLRAIEFSDSNLSSTDLNLKAERRKFSNIEYDSED